MNMFQILAGAACITALLCPGVTAQELPPNTTHPAPLPPLQVCATVPDLGQLVQEVGGDRVSVTTFVKGGEDPHFLEAKPSIIKAASRADLFVQVGLELEVGWVPAVLLQARNDKVQAGSPGLLDASAAITPLEVPSGTVDRSMGDVHTAGNPHFLLDPVCGLRVARLITDRLKQLRPSDAAYFDHRYEDFHSRVCTSLVGEELAHKYDAEKLAALDETGGLADFLASQGDKDKLKGWLGDMSPLRGTRVVTDHNLWTYFAHRFGVRVVGYLEPKPGVPPTIKHLKEIVEMMKRDRVGLVLASPYFDARHPAFVAEQTGAKVVALTHQCGGLPDTGTYIQMCDHNVQALVAACKEHK